MGMEGGENSLNDIEKFLKEDDVEEENYIPLKGEVLHEIMDDRDDI